MVSNRDNVDLILHKDLEKEVILHQMRLFGVPSIANRDDITPGESALFLWRPDREAVATAIKHATVGRNIVAYMPEVSFAEGIGVVVSEEEESPAVFTFEDKSGQEHRLRTLHKYRTFRRKTKYVHHLIGTSNATVWGRVNIGNGAIVLVGTQMAYDITRYRQGDPAQVDSLERQSSRWGVDGERSVYLYEKQRAGECPHERHADLWGFSLANVLEDLTGQKNHSILPWGVPGALVITGDDDQAFLEKYEQQLKTLEGRPITYFLHPKTRHTRRTLKAIRKRSRIDLALHPDALDAPNRYGELLHAQCAWFKRLTGHTPLSVRNHGFLNEGYWGHAIAWMVQGILFSSNIPGLDGTVLNGSLLPARLAIDGRLSEHWSILTAFGDGMISALGMSDQEASDRILQLGNDIRKSKLPGVIVLNLHPQNIDSTQMMHQAALDLIDSGFIAWTMKDCLEWFAGQDGSRLNMRRYKKPGWLDFYSDIYMNKKLYLREENIITALRSFRRQL